MSKRLFLILLSVVALAEVLILLQQRNRVNSLRQQSETRANQSHPRKLPEKSLRPQKPPSLELLRLRNEVTMLGQEINNQPQRPPPTATGLADEWAEVHSGTKASDLPDFVVMNKLQAVGNATPHHAYQTFQYAMRHQQQEPLTPAKMKEIWDVPDDFDDPDARYSISMGQGMGGEIGYRVVKEEFLSTNEIKLTLDFENPDGSTFRQERLLVQRNGKWRVKPESVSRQQ